MSLARRRTWIALAKLSALAVATTAVAALALASPALLSFAPVLVATRFVPALRAGLLGRTPPVWDFHSMTGTRHLGVKSPAPSVVWPHPAPFAFIAGDPLAKGVCGFCLAFDTDPGVLETLVPGASPDGSTLVAEHHGVRIFAAHRGSLRVVLTPCDTATLALDGPGSDTDPNDPYRNTVALWLAFAEQLGATPAQLAEMRHLARFSRPLETWDTLGSRLYQHRRRVAAALLALTLAAAGLWSWRNGSLSTLAARLEAPPPTLAHERADSFRHAWDTAFANGVTGTLDAYLSTWSFPDELRVTTTAGTVTFNDGAEACEVDTTRAPAGFSCVSS